MNGRRHMVALQVLSDSGQSGFLGRNDLTKTLETGAIPGGRPGIGIAHVHENGPALPAEEVLQQVGCCRVKRHHLSLSRSGSLSGSGAGTCATVPAWTPKRCTASLLTTISGLT